MKKMMFLLMLLLPASLLFAQAQEGVVAYQKTQQPAAFIHLPYSPGVVNDAMDDYLSKKGTRSDQLKGFKTFRNTRLSDNDTVYADLNFKVARMSRQDKDKTTVYLLVGMPNTAMAQRQPAHPLTVVQAKAFLDHLVPVIEAFNLEQLIKEQNDVVIKEEKKYNGLIHEGSDLNKRKSDIESRIIDNQQHQEKQDAEVKKQKQALAQLVVQRKL